jgi:hypothetical protein
MPLVDRHGRRLRSEKKTTSPVVLVIFESDTGDEGTWSPLKPEQVPEWLKDPDTLARLRRGDVCQDIKHSPKWYSAQELRRH